MLVALRMLIARSVSDLGKELRLMVSNGRFAAMKVWNGEYMVLSYLPKSTLRELDPP